MKRKVTAMTNGVVLEAQGFEKLLNEGEFVILDESDWKAYKESVRRLVGSGAVQFQIVEVGEPSKLGQASRLADSHNKLLQKLDESPDLSEEDHSSLSIQDDVP